MGAIGTGIRVEPDALNRGLDPGWHLVSAALELAEVR